MTWPPKLARLPDAGAYSKPHYCRKKLQKIKHCQKREQTAFLRKYSPKYLETINILSFQKRFELIIKFLILYDVL